MLPAIFAYTADQAAHDHGGAVADLNERRKGRGGQPLAQVAHLGGQVAVPDAADLQLIGPRCMGQGVIPGAFLVKPPQQHTPRLLDDTCFHKITPIYKAEHNLRSNFFLCDTVLLFL